MPYLDRPDIPAPLLAALKSDSYEESLDSHFDNLPEETKKKFKYTISVTTLARSPRQRILFNRHRNEIMIDPIDRFWAILGRTVHSILDDRKLPHQVIRDRTGVVIPVVLKKADPKTGRAGMKVDVYLHGEIDLYDPIAESIEDWKFTKAESMLYNKEDHEAQLNVLAFIWNKAGKKVKKIGNTYLFRNWEARFVKEGNAYPKERIYVKDIPLWPEERTLEYITRRLHAHFINEGFDDDDIAHCTDAERWVRDPSYKVYKMDEVKVTESELEKVILLPQKMAKFTAESMIEAEDKIEELKAEEWRKALEKNNALKKPKPEEDLKKAEYMVKEIKAEPVRCSYCEVREICSQRRDELIDLANSQGPQSTESEMPTE